MNKTSKTFLGYGIGIIFLLLVASLIFLKADKTKIDTPQLSLELNFAATIGTLLAVALALIAIGYSIKKADIKIYLGNKTTTPAGTLQEIRVSNTGDATVDLAFAFVELNVPASSPISFSGATGLPFQPTQNLERKQYRFNDPQHTRNLYPVKDDWSLIGFVQMPIGAANQFKLSVKIVGTQGRTQKEFKITR